MDDQGHEQQTARVDSVRAVLVAFDSVLLAASRPKRRKSYRSCILGSVRFPYTALPHDVGMR